MKVYSKERGYRKLKEGVSLESYREKYPSAIQAKRPSDSTMEKWVSNCYSRTPDGCKVEPDGTCSHGFDSWLKILGYI